MFNIGLGEVVVVGIVALWVLGPHQLSLVARLLAKWLGRLRQTAQKLKTEISQEMMNEDKKT